MNRRTSKLLWENVVLFAFLIVGAIVAYWMGITSTVAVAVLGWITGLFLSLYICLRLTRYSSRWRSPQPVRHILYRLGLRRKANTGNARATRRLCEMLVVIYPPSMRQEFEEEISAHLEDEERHQLNAKLARLPWVLRMVWDLVKSVGISWLVQIIRELVPKILGP